MTKGKGNLQRVSAQTPVAATAGLGVTNGLPFCTVYFVNTIAGAHTEHRWGQAHGA
ncbi:hypothetical protein [Limnohabitans sp.]|uniref:hypothetical protein n=1 Tax=Limnohabitans sp. TaxID=1907725 RepID=UPI00333EDC50